MDLLFPARRPERALINQKLNFASWGRCHSSGLYNENKGKIDKINER